MYGPPPPPPQTHARSRGPHLAEDDVLAVKPGGGHGGDEELRTIRVLASVGHGQLPGPRVLELEVLVRKLLAVDRLAPGAVALGEVAALHACARTRVTVRSVCLFLCRSLSRFSPFGEVTEAVIKIGIRCGIQCMKY